MNTTELEILKKEIEHKEALAFSENYPTIALVKEILSSIYKIPAKDRAQFEAYHKQLGEKLFKKGVKLKEFNPDAFKIQETTTPIKTQERIDDLDHKLQCLLNCIKDEYNHLRRFVILKFGEENLKTDILLLHDSYSKNPLLDKASNLLGDDCEMIQFNEFLSDLKESTVRLKKFYLALLIFSPNSSAQEGEEFLDTLSGYFNNIEQINVTQIDDLSKDFNSLNKNFEEIRREVRYLTEIDVINQELNPFEEKILKKLFSKNYYHTLEYKVLSSGFSGSKVIEVTPFKEYGNSAKYVVKIDNITSKERKAKIEGELKNFKQFIEGLDTLYTIDPEKTDTHIAIKYNYASTDSKIQSKSFASFYENPAKGVADFEVIVRKLFDITLFKSNWDVRLNKHHNLRMGDLYTSYINLEKIKKVISRIQDISVDKVNSLPLLENFKKISDHKMSVKTKVCHGDLHTENFFIDEKENVFLIDFGDTNKHHSVIDYVTLECSIKFRHIPFYIELDVLDKIEDDLLSPSSFSTEFRYNSIKRSDLTKPFHLIAVIRQLSNQFISDESNKLDYLIALFMLTFRQVRYDGLNQLYAYKVAEKLGNRIVSLI
ncbi:phosphotransferase [Terrimonas pollutisoli]|uniref:phosphotransferase n=1 Tax=Terrimonas pollutisoli TaxID=3034147 RepID=UPI0023EAAAD0|nr:phosphotransferase [Terrimonas sp. H1YJ31]